MIATWNVRGLNASIKQRDVLDFVRKNKLGLIGLLETKLKKGSIDDLLRRYFGCWQSVDNCDQYPRGRIWILWRTGEFSCRVIQKDKWYIHLEAHSLSLHSVVTLTIVYAPNELLERYAL